MHFSTKRGEQGFTLVELLIAMALALVIIASLSSTFIIQQKTYNTQEQIAEMTQNARAAMDIMSREIMMAGYAVPRPKSPSVLSDWITWVLPDITFTSGPVVLEDNSGDGNTDIIHVAACFGEPAMTTTLGANASATNTTITVADGSKFNTTKKKLISINGIESAIVTGVSVNTLTVDTDPITTGNQGLENDHQSGSSVCIVKVISYSIVQDDDGSYILKRNENLDAGRQPVAENIVNLQVNTVTDSGGKLRALEIDPLTAQTDKPDPNYSQNNGYRTFDQQAYITPPNLLIK